MRSLLLLPLLLAACAPAATTTRVFPDVALTLPAPAGADTVRVIVMGDQGKGGAVQDAVARAMRAVCRDLGCDLGLGMGDNFYPKARRTRGRRCSGSGSRRCTARSACRS